MAENASETRVLRDSVEQEVSPLELLFDLVFILGVTQLTRHLVTRPTWRGAAQTAVLYLPMFAAWAYTSWAATLYSPSYRPARVMVLAVMAAGLFMNASLTRAFDGDEWVFVTTFLGIQVGRTLWTLATPLDPISREHSVATLVWLTATAPIWIAGATASGDLRLGLWGAAAAIEFTGIWLAHPLRPRRLTADTVEFGGEHMIERCRLFLLIALGETVATPGAALATAPVRASSLAGGALALAGTLSLWWLYFQAEPLAVRDMARTDDRVTASRIGTNGLLFMIAGLIAMAAGNALVIDDPSHEAGLPVVLMLCGGPAIFLLARAWYQRRVFAVAPRPQLLAIAALATTSIAARTAPRLIPALAAVAILVGLVVREHLTAA